jgi:hypothetical protein
LFSCVFQPCGFVGVCAYIIRNEKVIYLIK